MKKIKIGILLRDYIYVERLQRVIRNEYANEADIREFENLPSLMEVAKNKKLDLVLLDEKIEVNYEELSRYCAIAVMSSVRRYDRGPEYGVIYKYQHIEELLGEFFNVYDEHHGFARVIAFTGASGGAGTSTIAAACAKSLASRNKKVLYINGETSTPDDYYLKDSAEMKISLASAENISNLYCDKDYAIFEKLLEEVKYDFIVMDVQNSMIQYKDFLDSIYELVIVEASSGASSERALNIKKMADQSTNALIIKNKVDQYDADTMGAYAGFVPFMNEYDGNQLVDQISRMDVLEKIV